jgi:hypothetical protein
MFFLIPVFQVAQSDGDCAAEIELRNPIPSSLGTKGRQAFLKNRISRLLIKQAPPGLM